MLSEPKSTASTLVGQEALAEATKALMAEHRTWRLTVNDPYNEKLSWIYIWTWIGLFLLVGVPTYWIFAHAKPIADAYPLFGPLVPAFLALCCFLFMCLIASVFIGVVSELRRHGEPPLKYVFQGNSTLNHKVVTGDPSTITLLVQQAQPTGPNTPYGAYQGNPNMPPYTQQLPTQNQHL